MIGEAPAGEFLAFAEVWGKLPSVESIVAYPQGAYVPQPNEPALTYALCGALAREATRSNLAAIVSYAERLPSDFTVLLVTDAIRRDPALRETRAFIDWASNNAAVLI